MIRCVTGDILMDDSQAIINTVNCKGVMGKGLAFSFKTKYPLMYKSYREMCLNGELFPGNLHIYEGENKIIINFPTKVSWRSKSKIEYIEAGLNELKKVISEKEINSIAIPPLGAGNGGLEWQDVKKKIIDSLSDIEDEVDITIYEPFANNKIASALDLLDLELIQLKLKLEKFNMLRLQSAMYMKFIYKVNDKLKFEVRDNFAFYSKEVLEHSKKIKNISLKEQKVSQKELYNQALSSNITKSINIESEYSLYILEKINEVFNILEDSDIILLVNILFILKLHKCSEEQLEKKLLELGIHTEKKAIKKILNILLKNNLIENNIFGFVLSYQVHPKNK